jgi:hypothetical protein
MASMSKSLAQINKSLDGPKRLRSEKGAPHAFLASNEATYGLREGGAGFHRNRKCRKSAAINVLPMSCLIAARADEVIE